MTHIVCQLQTFPGMVVLDPPNIYLRNKEFTVLSFLAQFLCDFLFSIKVNTLNKLLQICVPVKKELT